ncbi:4-(cytidine 5'-diphospho)-2-C-methyl-D-erythritol kinase [Saxibacter everestensis]|uniref:4-diphosphocytidyl-2-C-methyl-D-erythritol kinase n=1 Tax=Saxibacter everestensis TaxID=2909229 RepID=A0ABY8QXH4_9MICO|nr:4-(cytidine 5'-diphospho)-2-C-methyl-D-erythritol kinase [Brevibacteriaceae bacterium ZFBP1038]
MTVKPVPDSLTVSARAPGKVNLHLGVGPLGDDGYHDVANLYQAVSLYETVTVTPADGFSVELKGPFSDREIPTDGSNLAIRAARLLADHSGIAGGVHITVTKNVPVAGGMGGGSADAAATLVACDELWNLELGKQELCEIGAVLGADVPFAIIGGTAIGLGRGDELTPALGRGVYHWVIATSKGELSTPIVYSTLDKQRSGRSVPDPTIPDGIMHALRSGDPETLAQAMHNDLQTAAMELKPELLRALDIGEQVGALAGIVSGSGPTLAFLVSDAEQALETALMLSASGEIDQVYRVTSPAGGARVIRPHDEHPSATRKTT